MDWRYQFGQHPAVALTAAAVIGYMVVPHARRQKELIVRNSHGESVAAAKATNRGMLSGIVTAAATRALRSGASMLAQHLFQSLLEKRTLAAEPSETLTPQSSHPPQHEHFAS